MKEIIIKEKIYNNYYVFVIILILIKILYIFDIIEIDITYDFLGYIILSFAIIFSFGKPYKSIKDIEISLYIKLFELLSKKDYLKQKLGTTKDKDILKDINIRINNIENEINNTKIEIKNILQIKNEHIKNS